MFGIGRDKFFEFFRFGIIGVLNTFVHGVVLAVAVEFAGLSPILGNLFAFFVSNVNSYVLNSKYNFGSVLSVPKYLKFLMASLLALGVTLMVSMLFDVMGYHYMVGFVAIIFLVPLFSFALMRIWVFSSARGQA